jgi:hypothetical protein
MKTIATLALLAASAFTSIAAQAHGTDAASRSAVTAELQRARSAGELDHAAREINGPSQASAQPMTAAAVQPSARVGGARSRMEVKAELQRARLNGELDWATAELYGVQRPTPAATSMATR